MDDNGEANESGSKGRRRGSNFLLRARGREGRGEGEVGEGERERGGGGRERQRGGRIGRGGQLLS